MYIYIDLSGDRYMCVKPLHVLHIYVYVYVYIYIYTESTVAIALPNAAVAIVHVLTVVAIGNDRRFRYPRHRYHHPILNLLGARPSLPSVDRALCRFPVRDRRGLRPPDASMHCIRCSRPPRRQSTFDAHAKFD